MLSKDIIGYFTKSKKIQLSIVIIIAVVFFLVLITNSDLRNNIYTNSTLLFLCAFVWILLLLALISIFYDLYRLNAFNNATYSGLMDISDGMLNRFSADKMFQSDELQTALETVGCAMIEISNLVEINEKYGRDAGDKALDLFCENLESVARDYGISVRNGGNEFLIVIAECTKETMEKCLEVLDNTITLENQTGDMACPLYLNTAYVLNSEEHFGRFSEVITKAYHDLHNKD
ncbi:MAG: diguanylate cyclase [Lachnospiraceae bacterium]|nr:diguanylate cyclase [Lachnospiraceae bacterium]